MRAVLKIIEQDARTSPEEIASMTGKTPQEVRDILRKAETDRVILGYRAQVNWERAGEEQVWALIEVKVTPQRDVGFDAVAERIYRFPEARSVYLVSGTYDLAVTVVGRTMQEVSAFVSEKLAPMESVQATVTHFLLKRYKDQGIIMEGGDRPQRLQVSP
ncbi:MAG TPA: Lrp/AsnC family transcriptional regulator [Dehalococcoidia bacterium]|nr:Lrp/AsnC family transcriptional regulator [Dehalococcoidia bacterium]